MINEQNSTQTNTPTSNNVQYSYPSNRFDLMNISPMANPPDLYSYYPTNLYQPFGTFDEQTQWGSNENSSAPLQYHPSMYPPSGLDLTRNLFDYPPSTYSSYHLGYTPPTGDMPWNAHQHQQQPTATSLIGNKKSSIYDEYPSNHHHHHHGPMVVNDLLAQQLSSMNLTNNDSNPLPGFTRPLGPKSYASVVSSDTINSTNTKPSPTIRSISNVSNDSFNSQQSHYNRDRSQPSSNGSLLNWSTTTTTSAANKTSSSEHQYNPKDFNFNPKGARFFVIKSYSEDDVHRSIKYNIWCSTEHGNKRLDTAFREREGKGPIYLFFSVNASGHFCGMAEMMSPVDYEHQNDVWHMSNKWQGQFEVKWIYVKDVPNQQFRNIRLENNENKPVTNSRDTQEIPYEKGKLMLKTIHMYRHKTSIFDDFQYYESKQAEENTNKQSTDSIRTSSSIQRTGKRLGEFHLQQE